MKLKLIITFLFLSYCASAQVKVNIDDRISFNLPNNTVKYKIDIDTSKADNLTKMHVLITNKNSYKVDNIVINLYPIKYEISKSLEETKKSTDNLTKPKKNDKTSQYTSAIYQRDGNQFLKVFRFAGKDLNYSFKFLNNQKKISFRFEIVCELKDQKKAEQIIEGIFKSLVIKP